MNKQIFKTCARSYDLAQAIELHTKLTNSIDKHLNKLFKQPKTATVKK